MLMEQSIKSHYLHNYTPYIENSIINYRKYIFINMANKTLKYNLEVDNLNETVREFEKFNDNIDESKQNLSKPIGDKAFDGLNQDLEKGVDATEKFEAAARKLDGGIKVLTGGVGIAAGVMGAFGAENEKVEETLLKVQSAIAFTTGIKDLTEGFTQLGTAQKAYNFVVGTSTGLMKAFKIALAATGVGLLVAGLALLITNFDTVKESVEKVLEKLPSFEDLLKSIGDFIVGQFTNRIDALKNIFIGVGSAIQSLVKGDLEGVKDSLKDIGTNYVDYITGVKDTVDKTTEAFNKAKDKVDEYTESIRIVKNAQKEIEDSAANLEDIEKRYDTEIRLAKAAGEDTKQLELEKQQAIQNTLDKQLSYFNIIKNENGKLTDEQIKQKEEVTAAFEEAKLRQKELTIQINNDIIASEEQAAEAAKQAAAEAKRKAEQEAADREQARKDAEEKKRIAEELAQERANIEMKAAAKLKVINAESDEDILNAKIDLLQTERDIALQNDELTKSQRLLIEAETNEQIKELRKQAAVETTEEVKTTFGNFSESFKETLGSISSGLSGASQAVGQLGDIFSSISDNRLQKIKNEENAQIESLQRQKEAGVITEDQLQKGLEKINKEARKKEEKEKKKAFKQQKAISIVEAIIGTAQGVVAGLGAPFPLNIIMPILAGVAGAAQIALISKQKYPEGGSSGGGGGATTPSLSIPDTASVNIPQAGEGGGGELVSFTPGSQGSISGGGFLNEGDNRQNTNNEKRPPITVAENDISNTQNRVRVIEDDAAFE